jgi:Derlin-2/3
LFLWSFSHANIYKKKLNKPTQMLEEGHFRGRTGDFLFCVSFGAALILAVSPFIFLPFCGASLTFMFVYVWSKLPGNRQVQMSFLGMFTFQAAMLPWVLLGFSMVLGSSIVVDLIGIGVGHAYFYLAVAYPAMTGRRLLKTPRWLKVAMGDADVAQVEHVRVDPSAFPGGGAVLGADDDAAAGNDAAAGGDAAAHAPQ